MVISPQDGKVDLQTFKEAVPGTRGALEKAQGLPIWKLMGMKAGLQGTWGRAGTSPRWGG